jgi:hypothetical protein
MTDPVVREFLLAFWKIHILHHAAEQGVYGHWMLEELRRHGYRLSPGTLYPLLARMARRGWLRSTEPKGPRDARVSRIGPTCVSQIEPTCVSRLASTCASQIEPTCISRFAPSASI